MKTTRDNYNFSQKSTSSLSGFEIFSVLDPIRYYFHFNGENGEALLYSQSYKTAQGRDKGVISLTKNLLIPSHYEIKTHEKKFFFIVIAGNHQELAQSRFFKTRKALLESMEFIKQFYAGEGDDILKTYKKINSKKIKKEEVPSSKHAFRIDIYMEENGMKGKIEHLLTKEKLTFSKLDSSEIIPFIEYNLKEHNNIVTGEESSHMQPAVEDLTVESNDDIAKIKSEEILEKEELILPHIGTVVPPAIIEEGEEVFEIKNIEKRTPFVENQKSSTQKQLKSADVRMEIFSGEKIIRRNLNRLSSDFTKIVLEFSKEISNQKPFLHAYYYLKKISSGNKIFESNFQGHLSPNHSIEIPLEINDIPIGTYHICVHARLGMTRQELELSESIMLKKIICVFELEEKVSKELMNSF